MLISHPPVQVIRFESVCVQALTCTPATMPFQSKFAGLLTYRTTRKIRVDIWWLGLGFRIIQALIVILIAYYAVQRDAWAYHEVPLGRVNAYGEKTAEFSRIGTTSPACD